MEEERQTRTRHKRKKRLRIGRVLILFILLAIIVGGIYSITQYRTGYKLANKEVDLTIDFEGDQLKSGERENILVLGVDSRGQKQARSDTMMLVSWDKQDNDVKIISFMRDIYADIPDHQSYKLNTAYYLGGVQLLKDTIQQMFDLPIHHYALIDFSSFESLVDILAPNGVPINVEKDMSEKIGVSLVQGQQNLSGEELLGYARYRADKEGDFGRVARQQVVMEALKNELFSLGNLSNAPKFLGAAEGYIETDYSRTDKAKRILDALISGKLQIEKLTIPVEGSYTFSSYKHAGSVLEINTDKNKQAIVNFLEK